MRVEINYFEWDFRLDKREIEVTHHAFDETRIYTLGEDIDIKRFEHEDEYIRLYDQNDYLHQFKFEEGDFLVGDAFDDKGEHIATIANWVFGEDLHMSN